MPQMANIYSIGHLAAKNVHCLHCAPVAAGFFKIYQLILSLLNSLPAPQ